MGLHTHFSSSRRRSSSSHRVVHSFFRREKDRKNHKPRRRRIPMETKRRLLAQQGYCCNHCGRELPWNWTVDHKTPLRDNGHPTAITNLQILDRFCHYLKTQRDNLVRRIHVRVDTRRPWRHRTVFYSRRPPTNSPSVAL